MLIKGYPTAGARERPNVWEVHGPGADNDNLNLLAPPPKPISVAV